MEDKRLELDKLAVNLRLLLKNRNTTQKDLAVALDMPPSTIGGYLRKKSEPDFETLKKIVDYFGVTYNDVFGNDNLPKYEYDYVPIPNQKIRELVYYYQQLNSTEQEVVLNSVKGIVLIDKKQRRELGR